MATRIRENFMELEGVLKTVYDLEMKKKKDYIPKLFNVDNSKRSEVKHFGIGGIGLMKPWTGQVDYDTVGKRWVQTYRHGKYSNGLQVEAEVVLFGEYNDLKKQTKQLSHSVYLTQQTHAASVFNNAFDTTVTGPDSKPLCAASTAGHPYSPDNASDTQYNAFALDLTTKNIDTIYNHMIDIKDDRGNVLGVNPSLLITGNYYNLEAERIVGTQKEPFTAENTKNLWSGFAHINFPWITGKKFFLADPDMMDMYLNWYYARKPKLEYEDNFNTETASYKVVGLWSYGWDEWFWIGGSTKD